MSTAPDTAGGDSLATMPAPELATAFRARRLSPVEVLEAVLARLDAVEPAINAFVHVDREGAMAQARAAEARFAAGTALGPLDGVPVAIKDMLLTRACPRAKALSPPTRTPRRIPTRPAVTRLRAQGAVLYGKTTTTELGGSPYSTSPLTGATRSPWHLGLWLRGLIDGGRGPACGGRGHAGPWATMPPGRSACPQASAAASG